MSTNIIYEREGAVATITLSPEQAGKPPTLDDQSLSDLEGAIAQAATDQPRVVLVRSASERFFCVGANINKLKDTNEETIMPWVMAGHRVLNKLEDLPMPVIAVVTGYAMGGGLELAMACDLIFSTDTAKLAQSEAGLGFIPGWGGTRRLAERVGTARAKYWYYSGAMIDATDGLSHGLVDYVGTADELEAEIARFSEATSANNANAVSQFKRIVNDQVREQRDANATVEAFGSISCLQDPDAKQRLHDFLNKKGKK